MIELVRVQENVKLLLWANNRRFLYVSVFKRIITYCKAKHFAIPSANFVDEISAKAHIEVAEEMNLPLILSFAQVHSKYQSLEEAANIGKYYANKAKVPVVLHLDHGEDFDFIKELLI